MKIFYCYSLPLKKFLLENGQKYFTSTVHNKTKKTCYLFEGTKELNKLLDLWRVREH